MSEILEEARVQDRNVITIPTPVREHLKISPGDYLRFELVNGNICVHKVIFRRVNNNSCRRAVNETKQI